MRIAFAVLLFTVPSTMGFVVPVSFAPTVARAPTKLYYEDDAPSDVEDEEEVEAIPLLELGPEAIRLKEELLDLASSTKRGFSASSADRQRANDLVSELMQLNPSEEPAAAYYVDAASPTGPTLSGKWTLVYTDAPDITTLDFGPLASAKLGRIGQECTPPLIKNVIEWRRPDWAANLPLSGTDESRILQKVCTEAVATPEKPTKVSLKLVGLDLLGMGTAAKEDSVVDAIRSDGLAAGLLENNPLELRGPLTAPFGEFEVLYLDDDMRIIRTSQGFVAVNVREEEWF